MPGKKHQDVSYHVGQLNGLDNISQTIVFHDFDSAAAYAVNRGFQGGRMVMDVIVYSEKGARSLFGEEGVKEYREDPSTSVFKRLKIKVDNVGRVP